MALLLSSKVMDEVMAKIWPLKVREGGRLACSSCSCSACGGVRRGHRLPKPAHALALTRANILAALLCHPLPSG